MATYHIIPGGTYEQWADLPSLVPTDVVTVERGHGYDRFDIDNLSGVTVSAVGAGSEPIFGSLKTASGWTYNGSGRWSITDAALGSYLNMLVFDGLPRRKGCFPKLADSYYTIPSDSSDGSLNHGTLPFDATGEVVIRLQGFVTNTYTVTGDSGGVITFTGHTGQYPPKQGYGFKLQNQVECLTEVGDWMYNSSTKTITVFFDTESPGDYVIQYPTEETAMTIADSDNLIFSGIQFVGANGDGVEIDNSPDLVFLNSSVKYAGGMGIRLLDGVCDDITFTGVRVDHAFAGGIYAFFGCDRVETIDCEVYNIGMVEGGSRYMNYDGRSNGICLEGGANNLIQGCRAEDVGFNAFVYGGNGTHVHHNIAKRFCAKKADGAGFYTYAGNPGATITDTILVHDNIAEDGIGNIAGTKDVLPNCQGFYFDDGTNGVHGYNLCAKNNPTGMYWHNIRNCDFNNIDLFGNRRGLRLNNDSGMTMTGNSLTDSWFILTAIDQEFGEATATEEEIAGFGTLSGNRYSRFKTGRPVFSMNTGGTAPYRYEVNPSAWFAALGETYYTLEDYDAIQYTVGDQLGTINYKTTTPTSFGLITGISNSQDATGITITKSAGPKTVGFLRLGPVVTDQWYLAEGDVVGTDYDHLQVDLEPNYDAPGTAVKNCKIDAASFALPLYSEATRAVEQFYLLMEAPFASLKFENFTFSEITVTRMESTAAIDIDEDEMTWEIALDGEFEVPVVVNVIAAQFNWRTLAPLAEIVLSAEAIAGIVHISMPLPSVDIVGEETPVTVEAVSGIVHLSMPLPSVDLVPMPPMVVEAIPGTVYIHSPIPAVAIIPPPKRYLLDGTDMATFGILPGRAPNSDIAIEGHLDFPTRRNKTGQVWGDQNGLEPYVSASEIMFNGRDITFYGFVKGSSRADLDIKILALYELIDSAQPDQLMDFSTPWGNFQVYVNGEIETKAYRNNYSKLKISFREPVVDLTGGIVPENGDPESITGIDGVDFSALGFGVVDMPGMGIKTTGIAKVFNRAQPQAQNAIGYFKEAFQITKTGPKNLDLNSYIQVTSYADLMQTVKNLYAVFKAPGTRVLYLNGDRLRIVYCKDGFELSYVRSEGKAKMTIHLTVGEEYGEESYNVLGDVAGNYVTTTTGQKILLKL